MTCVRTSRASSLAQQQSGMAAVSASVEVELVVCLETIHIESNFATSLAADQATEDWLTCQVDCPEEWVISHHGLLRRRCFEA